MRKRRKRLERGVRETHPTEDDARQSLKRCRGRERARNSKIDSSRTKSRSKSTDASKRYHRTKPIPPTYVEDADAELSASDRSRSPPSSQQHTLKKKPSITMPGSLFPRSSSLEPDTRDNCLLASPLAGPSGMANGASSTSQSHSNQTDPSSIDTFVSPWRTRPVSSVHDAIQRFNITAGEEADFSLRLPTPHSSPAKPSANPPSGADTSLQLASDFVKPSSSAKGKERMQDDDLLYILGDVPNADTRIQAKERELVAAREEHKRQRLASGGHSIGTSDERERERDKERIRMLEEEVRQLREELSRSRRRSPGAPPPPPPPPPIPPPLPIRIDTSSSSSDQSTLFASARAALRHTSPPQEAPIIAGTLNRSRMKRQGQPTFNVPSEKMAAFLNEIKTVRLRKVGEGGGTGTAADVRPAEPSNLSKSTSALSWASGPIRPEVSRRQSLVNLARTDSASSSAKETLVRAGQKRKADAMGIDELVTSHVAKRQLTQVSTGGSSSSGSSSSQSAPTSKSGQASLESSKRPWSSQSTNETDITTPSLCSDNERDGDGSLEDQVPSTPPGPRSTHPERRPDIREPEVIGVDMESDIVGGNTRPQLIRTGSPRIPRTLDMFEKRPPMSPIPHPTPRKPTAPSRARRISTPKPKYIPPDSDSDNGTNRAETPFLSLIPGPRSNKSTLSGKGRPPGAQNGSSSRRASKNGHRSLEEELRSAGAHASGDGLVEDDLFVGTGTRSQRRGFLARGGAGGSPVLMGVGYVRDAQVSDGEVRNKESTRRIHKSASQGSLIPRLGGKSCS